MFAHDTMNLTGTRPSPERLTWAEICRRYPDRWVVLVQREPTDPVDDVDLVSIELCTAVVIGDHETRKAAFSTVDAAYARHAEVGSYFTGRLVPPSHDVVDAPAASVSAFSRSATWASDVERSAIELAAVREPERLTWVEICQRYPDEWVVLVETSWTSHTDFEFGTALVLARFKTRTQAAPFVRAAYEHYDQVGAFFTGRLVPAPGERAARA